MPSTESVIAYIEQLPGKARFFELEIDEQMAYVFNALETLKAHFGEGIKLNDRAAALQTLYMLDGDLDEYAQMKAQGVESYQVKDVRVAFREGAGNLHPDVHDLILTLNPQMQHTARVGRLI